MLNLAYAVFQTAAQSNYRMPRPELVSITFFTWLTGGGLGLRRRLLPLILSSDIEIALRRRSVPRDVS